MLYFISNLFNKYYHHTQWKKPKETKKNKQKLAREKKLASVSVNQRKSKLNTKVNQLVKVGS